MNNTELIKQACQFSFYLQRTLDADKDLAINLPEKIPQAITHADFEQYANWNEINSSIEIMQILRKLRREVMARLIVRDLAHLADLSEVVRSISEFADFALLQALRVSKLGLAKFGQPIGEESQLEQELIIICMGKLGGSELNVSSDIDLIFVYPEEGQTNGTRQISLHQYFVRQSKEIIRILDEITADGRVFRVDMRLRPYGDSGALAISFSSLENYLISQGREWERYAWIKARAISGKINALMSLVSPFVYRKYLDYSAYDAMRTLHKQIRCEVARRDMADNIKLGDGGIREIEFIVQLFQLVRGGREKLLRNCSTRQTLNSLQILQLLESKDVSSLTNAYVFLRNLEHRLQYLDDQQTQTLPTKIDDQTKIALSMNHQSWNSFLSELTAHRACVSRQFDLLFLLGEDETATKITRQWAESSASEISQFIGESANFNPEKTKQLLHSLYSSHRYKQMPEAGKKKLEALIGPLLCAAAKTENPDITLLRLFDLLDAIGGRTAYLSLLVEYPEILNMLAELYAKSNWVSSYITRHPILLDDLIDRRNLYIKPDWEAFAKQLSEQLFELDNQDVEGKMDALRHFQHSHIFRLAVQDLSGMWSIEALSDQLSQLADITLEASLKHAWLSIKNRHRNEAKFAIIAYGKLGGKELGYASDLDIIFIYDDEHPDAPTFYAKLARRLSSWLSSTTSAGSLYEIDLRLRPNGSSGMLVSTLQAFANYQKNHAWVWEHQALTRARYVAGDVFIGEQFTEIRHNLLMQKHKTCEVKQEVIKIREKMFATHPPLDLDIKYARGGVVDVEFIVQYLILEHANHLPELTQNSGNIALLLLAAKSGLIKTSMANKACAAYRYFRSLQHSYKLRDCVLNEVNEELTQHYQAVIALWRDVFAEEANFI